MVRNQWDYSLLFSNTVPSCSKEVCISSNHGHGLADYNNATARSVTLLFSPLFTSKCGEITQLCSVAKPKVLKCVVVKESALENRKAEN